MDKETFITTRPFRKLYQKEGVLAVIWKTSDEPIDGFMDAVHRPMWISVTESLFRVYGLATRKSTLMETLSDGEPVLPLMGDKPLNYHGGEYRICVLANERVKLAVVVYKGHSALTKSLQRMVRSALKQVERYIPGDG